MTLRGSVRAIEVPFVECQEGVVEAGGAACYEWALREELRLQTIDIQPRTRATYRYLYYAICMAIMYGLFEFVYFMITGISRQFGHGFFAGTIFAAVMFYLGSRAEESERRGR
jgi:hypothetical protein